MDGFGIILQIGAGTGLIYILRWFWWRINAYTEIAGMVVSFAVAMFFKFFYAKTGWPELNTWQQLLAGVTITTSLWLLVTWITPATDREVLKVFCETIRPSGSGWKQIRQELAAQGIEVEAGDSITDGLRAMFAATFAIFAILFGTGYLLYGEWISLCLSLIVAAIAVVALIRWWPAMESPLESSESEDGQ